MKSITDEDFKALTRIKEIGLSLLEVDKKVILGDFQKGDVQKRSDLMMELNCIAVRLSDGEK